MESFASPNNLLTHHPTIGQACPRLPD